LYVLSARTFPPVCVCQVKGVSEDEEGSRDL
jgi:hypothetical protein